MDDLNDFFAALASSNPFIDNRVNGVSVAEVDVEDIHRTAFDRLTGLARDACSLRRGLGAMVLGEAGTGKSHLLARLIRWAGQDNQAVAVYLHNLQASPENLPRSVLKAVVSVLTRGRVSGFASTPLFELAFQFVMEALHFDTSQRKVAWPVVERQYRRLVDGLSAQDPSRAALVNRTVYDVLYRFFHTTYRLAKTRDERPAQFAVRWLSGERLDPDEARLLGLTPGAGDEPMGLGDNQEVKQVLVALCRMALSRNRPFLLCFDQVDNLDEDQAAALSRFLEAMIDSAPNLLVVNAGVQASLLRWREMKVFQDSAWDRLAQFEIQLLKLTPAECRRIVSRRLEQFFLPFSDREPVRQLRQQDDLFPLGRAWSEDFFRNKIDLRPREAIKGAHDGWRREQGALQKGGGLAWLTQWGKVPCSNGDTPAEWTEEQVLAAVDQYVSQKITEQQDRRRQQPETLPPDAENLAGLIATLLGHTGEFAIERSPLGGPNPHFPFDLVARRREGAEATGVRCLAETSAASTTASLRWLRDAATRPGRIFLVTDERRPLKFGSRSDARGRALFEELRQLENNRFAHIEVAFDEYVQLDALQAVIGLARSGKLEIDLAEGRARRLDEQDVIESLRRLARHLAAPVIRDFFPAVVPDNSLHV